MELLLIFAAALLLPLALQLFLLRLERPRLGFLRWLVPLAALPWLFLAWRDYHSGGWFSGLTTLFDLLLAVLILLGWGLAWAIHALLVWRKQHKADL